MKLGTALVLTFCVVGLTGCLRVGSDAAALRNSLTQSTANEWDKKIEIGVGQCILFVARAGLSRVDMPVEARTALSAVRSAEVGVYERHARGRSLDYAAMLSAADTAMSGRGWDRFVTVCNSRQLVAVYVPEKARSTRDVQVCLAVVSEGELVLASARSNLEPLMAMASSHLRAGQDWSIR
jgi:hypothetical protein